MTSYAYQPCGLAARDGTKSQQKQLAVFHVGVAKPRIHQKLCTDLVTLSKAGCTVLSKGTHSKTPAASNLDEWR